MSDYYEDQEDEMEHSMHETASYGGVTVTLSSQALQEMATAIQYAVVERLRVSIEKAVNDKMRALVDEAVRKVVGEKAEKLVLEAIEKPRQKFDVWGTPTGPTVAFADIIPSVVESYLNERVNDKGAKDSYSSSVPRANWIIARHIREHLDPAVSNAVSSITKQARDIVTAKVSAFVAEQMIPAVDVKTLERPR